MKHSARGPNFPTPLLWIASLLALLTGGCGGGTAPASDPPPAPISATTEVAAGASIVVVDQADGYAKTLLGTGEVGYVEIDNIQRLASGGSAEYLVVQPAPFLHQPPSPPPEPATEPTTAPRPRQQILAELQDVSAGYIASDSGSLVLGPLNYVGPYRDPASGQWCWPAYLCNHPNCPGKKAGKPHLFPARNPALKVGPDGTVSSAIPQGVDPATWFAQHGLATEPLCPECLKTRDRAHETPRDAETYRLVVRRYIAPESQARAKQALEEYRRLLKQEQAQRAQSAGSAARPAAAGR